MICYIFIIKYLLLLVFYSNYNYISAKYYQMKIEMNEMDINTLTHSKPSPIKPKSHHVSAAHSLYG